MWTDALRDGRPAEYRFRPLFNSAVWLTPTTEEINYMKSTLAITTPRSAKFENKFVNCKHLLRYFDTSEN